LRINGDVHVGGKFSGGHVSRLDGTETTPDVSDLKSVKRISVYADTISFNGSGKPEKYGLHTDFENGKEELVLNFPQNPYGKSFKDGVRVEGNLRVTGAFSQASSIALKENVAELSGQEAVATLQGLNAVKYNYKADETKEQRLGFIAEDVPDLVASSERDRLSPMDIIAVLTKAMQEQQKTIADLAAEVNTLKQHKEAK
jgi:Chaperone of endosialidase